MKNFQDKIVVITGAGSGMGRAYALQAAQRGARLALNDFDADALKRTLALLPAGADVLSEAFDVSQREKMYAFADQVATELGNADVVINNAGIEGEAQPVWATSDEAYERVMSVNFFGVVHGTRAFLPQLLDGNDGYIVNVSSLFGLIGPPNHADYCAAKFAVRGFTECLAAELLGTRVRVYTLHPGGINTNIARAQASSQFKSKYLTTSPEDIVRVVFDRLGSSRTRIVYGHRASSTWLGARLLPQRLMNRLTARDLGPILDKSAYPAHEWYDSRSALAALDTERH